MLVVIIAFLLLVSLGCSDELSKATSQIMELYTDNVIRKAQYDEELTSATLQIKQLNNNLAVMKTQYDKEITNTRSLIEQLIKRLKGKLSRNSTTVDVPTECKLETIEYT